MKAVRTVIVGSLLTSAWVCLAVHGQESANRFTAPQYAAQQNNPGGQSFFWNGQPSYLQQGQSITDSRQLAHKYLKAEGEEEKAKIRKELTEAVAREFDEHVKRQGTELGHLEKKLDQLKNLAKKRTEAKSTIVKQRIEQLSQNAKGLGWVEHGQVTATYFANSPYGGLVGQPGEDENQLAAKYVKADGEEEKTDVLKKLTTLLERQFDELRKAQDKELAGLEKQIAHVKSTMKKRSEVKNAIVDRRVEQLILEADGLGWSSSEAHDYFQSRSLGR